MRHFTDFEKNIIDSLCDAKVLSDDSSISNLVQKHCKCSLQWTDSNIEIIIDKNQDKNQAVSQVLTIICLLDYLTSENLIYTFNRLNIKSRSAIINKSLNHVQEGVAVLKLENLKIEDNHIELPGGKHFIIKNAVGYTTLEKIDLPWSLSQKIDYYLNSVFFCTETLKVIKKNGYEDDDTIRYKNNKIQTWIAIGVAFVTGVVSIIVSCNK